MRHSGAESAGYLLLLRAMISFNVKLRVSGTSTAPGSGSGCPSGKLMKYSCDVWSRTNLGSTQTETSRAIIVTRRPDAAAMLSVANLFPVRPGVTLLFVFLSSEGFDAKALRTLVADGDFRRLAAYIANVMRAFGLGVGSQRNYLHTSPPC